MVELQPEISERLNIQRIIPYKGVTLSADLKMRLKNAETVSRINTSRREERD